MEHHFKVEDAKEYGIECAILLYNIRYWIEKNKANGKHFHDGRYWTYNSGVAFAKLFPYLTSSQILRHLRSLESIGVLISGNYNNLAYDKTKWYAIAEKPCSNLNNDDSNLNNDDSEMNNGEFKSEQPIPDRKPNRKTDRKNERDFPPSPSILLPNNLESYGTNIPSKPSGLENHSKSEIGGEFGNLQPSKAPQPPDVEKIGNEMFNLLRKRVPKPEMSEILDSIDIDLPTLSKMFTEYWLYQKGEKFNSSNWKGLVSSFTKWINIAKTKEIPAKETTSGIHAKPIMEKVLHEVGKKKRMTLSPTDAGKVNKFIAESGVSDKALEHGTKNFCSGSGNTWDQWIFVVGNAIKAEKLGEI